MIVLGRIVAPFGIQGWVKIHPFGDDPLSWRKMPRWWVCRESEAEDAQWRPLQLNACKLQGRSVVASFVESPDRNTAEALEGFYIGAPRETLPEPAENEYYWADLIGLAVVNQQGEALGQVVDLISTGVHDVLQIQDGETERLIPFVAAYVLDVNQNTRIIQVDWQKDW